jgi:hypothetical protein
MKIDRLTMLNRAIKQWTIENEPSGKECGYPQCCIDAFCRMPPEFFSKKSASEMDKLRYAAAHIDGHYTGFIPCADHAKQIMSGKITLASLIQNRNPKLKKFPNQW